MGDLREEVRLGTLRRMRRALAETDARLERLRADGRPPGDAQVQEAAAYRDRLVASIAEVSGQPDGTTYPPEAIRVLEGMDPPRRPAGHVEDAADPEWLALPPEVRAAALERAAAPDVQES